MKHKFSEKYGEISLEPLNVLGSEQYRQLRNKAENRKWFVFDKPISKEEQKQWFEKYLNTPNDYMFSIYLKDEYIGGLALYQVDEELKSAEFGRLLISKHGCGLGLEALKAAIVIAKRELNIQKLSLEVYVNNYAAITIYQKAGFNTIGEISNASGEKMLKMVLDIEQI